MIKLQHITRSQEGDLTDKLRLLSDKQSQQAELKQQVDRLERRREYEAKIEICESRLPWLLHEKAKLLKDSEKKKYQDAQEATIQVKSVYHLIRA